jgi:hypothetical protein
MLGNALESFIAEVEQKMPSGTVRRANGSPVFGCIQQRSVTLN